MPPPEAPAVHLRFHAGTLRVEGLSRLSDGGAALAAASASAEFPSGGLKWDAREGVHRLAAVDYAPFVMKLRALGVPYADEARGYATLELRAAARHEPFPFQREALGRWKAARSRGVVVLPTGAGKTFVASLAIAEKQRSTLVVVPTIDLLNQWYDVLSAAFGTPVGIVGGGYHEVEEITVTTYDSAHIHMERLGARFGLVVFDECHHLPSPSYALAAKMCLAPFRLGLTATPERADARGYEDTIGPIVYRKDISELSGEYLASYEVVRLDVPLSDAEREEYEERRGVYLSFLRSHRIRMGEPSGWGEFLRLAAQSEEGREAFLAYRKQRALALAAPGKLDVLARILHAHRGERTIVFTEDNATVYAISRRFLLPAITHQTKIKERSELLSAFNAGELTSLVTSKVLNEGVNVPEAGVAVVLSGSGSVREHVQRLGRILRKTEGKRAVLYEIVAAGTSEERTSEKRRDHSAYRERGAEAPGDLGAHD